MCADGTVDVVKGKVGALGEEAARLTKEDDQEQYRRQHGQQRKVELVGLEQPVQRDHGRLDVDLGLLHLDQDQPHQVA